MKIRRFVGADSRENMIITGPPNRPRSTARVRPAVCSTAGAGFSALGATSAASSVSDSLSKLKIEVSDTNVNRNENQIENKTENTESKLKSASVAPIKPRSPSSRVLMSAATGVLLQTGAVNSPSGAKTDGSTAVCGSGNIKSGGASSASAGYGATAVPLVYAADKLCPWDNFEVRSGCHSHSAFACNSPTSSFRVSSSAMIGGYGNGGGSGGGGKR